MRSQFNGKSNHSILKKYLDLENRRFWNGRQIDRSIEVSLEVLLDLPPLPCVDASIN